MRNFIKTLKGEIAIGVVVLETICCIERLRLSVPRSFRRRLARCNRQARRLSDLTSSDIRTLDNEITTSGLDLEAMWDNVSSTSMVADPHVVGNESRLSSAPTLV